MLSRPLGVGKYWLVRPNGHLGSWWELGCKEGSTARSRKEVQLAGVLEGESRGGRRAEIALGRTQLVTVSEGKAMVGVRSISKEFKPVDMAVPSEGTISHKEAVTEDVRF